MISNFENTPFPKYLFIFQDISCCYNGELNLKYKFERLLLFKSLMKFIGGLTKFLFFLFKMNTKNLKLPL